ncbi:chemokine XC receptor 1-like [Solea solea]|uniref:chemokine XC receptor 1-like n=1 Tax=Solea solea TaxID=90069 RepID=UPI00272C494C|nr:chemokine XC receptor 1-like [Solea solea]
MTDWCVHSHCEDFLLLAEEIMATTEPFMVTDNNSNYYSNDYENELCDKSSVTKFGGNFTVVFYSIVVILSVFGNSLIIGILAKFENLKSLTNAFILNLAVSDLFFTTGLPFWAYYHIHGWTLGEPACKIVSFVFYVGFYSSGVLLILMTAQRYVAVMYPLSDIMSTTSFYGVLASVIIWAVSILIASPAFMFTKVTDHTYCGYAKSYWSLWGIYQQNGLFAVSSVVFIFCYSQIICRLLRPNAQRKKKNKTLKLIFILLVVFFVGWAPYNVVIFLQSMHYWHQEEVDSKDLVAICETRKPLEYAFYISRNVAVCHCCLNPVFYVFVGVKFKNHLKKILKSWGHNNSSSSSIRNLPSRLTIISVTSGEEFSM